MQSSAPEITLARRAYGLQVQLAGTWRLSFPIPTLESLRRAIDAEAPARITFDTTNVTAWDSSLVVFVTRVLDLARTSEIDVDRSGLPHGVPRLLELVETPADRRTAPQPHPSLFTRVGLRVIDRRAALHRTLGDIGELVAALLKLATGTARFQHRELWLQMQATGARALGIVALVAGLVGLIIAFISSIQLRAFGATLYVASLVGIAMVRELGAVMAGIVIAGRTGAAFAAELATMRVTQEIDALSTLGLSRVELLVLPRVLAVTLMLPLLTVFADLLGVLGGAVVGIGLLHISPRLYLDQTLHAVTLTDLVGGIVKATTYGFLIGVAGCFIGLHAGRTAAAVGRATTSAVVAGIVLVIVACGTYAVLFFRLGI